MENIIKSLNLSTIETILYSKMARSFEENLPNSLHMDHQELILLVPNSKIEHWDTFLSFPEIDRYIEQKLAKHLKIHARKALHRLTTQDDFTTLSSADIQSLKHIIESSKILEQKHQNKQTVFVTFIPRKEENMDENSN